MLYGWMVQTGSEGKPYIWVRFSAEDGLREWANVQPYGVLNNQAAKELQKEQMPSKHREFLPSSVMRLRALIVAVLTDEC